LQDALDEVSPGDTIRIESGDYWEDPITRVDGKHDERITIEAAGGASDRGNVVVRGTGAESRVFQVMHDYYTLQDFTIDGQAEDDADQDNFKAAFRNILLYTFADRLPFERDGGYKSALDGLIVRGMNIQNAGGECVRLRDFVTFADIDGNSILNCGLYDFVFDDGDDGKNGEGIYIGTSSKQWDDGKNSSDDPDMCQGIVIRNNQIVTHGNEGVEVKEGCLDTIIRDNRISMQRDDDGGGM
ncbi:unnamed protein product, partial [Laminaria digitata]